MEVDGESKVAASNSESAITKTVTESDEKFEATSTTAAADGDAAKADTSDAAAAAPPSTIEIDDSSDDSNNQKLPSAQSNDAAVTDSDEVKSKDVPSASVVEKNVEVAVDPTPAAADGPPVSTAPVATPADDANVNDDANAANADDKRNAPAKDAVNDANSKPQEAANGTKQTSDAVPAIKIDEANDNEKKTEKLVACKCAHSGSPLSSSNE